MQTIPTGWDEARSVLYRWETKVTIAGVEYGESDIYSLSTSGALFSSGTVSIGGCVSREIDLVVTPRGAIPRMAEIRIFVRPIAEGIFAEWLPKGVFYIDTRQTDRTTGLMTIHGYDAMLKTEQTYLDEGDVGEWPRPMDTVAMDIAARIGVALDSRTIVTSKYNVAYPNDYTMREILGFIAVAHAGNWIISDTGELYLVPLNRYRFLDAYIGICVLVEAAELSTAPTQTVEAGVDVYSGFDAGLTADPAEGMFAIEQAFLAKFANLNAYIRAEAVRIYEIMMPHTADALAASGTEAKYGETLFAGLVSAAQASESVEVSARRAFMVKKNAEALPADTIAGETNRAVPTILLAAMLAGQAQVVVAEDSISAATRRDLASSTGVKAERASSPIIEKTARLATVVWDDPVLTDGVLYITQTKSATQTDNVLEVG